MSAFMMFSLIGGLEILACCLEWEATEESACEVKGENLCEIASHCGQPQGQSAHQWENQEVMNEYPLLNENVELSPKLRHETRLIKILIGEFESCRRREGSSRAISKWRPLSGCGRVTRLVA